ncbi:L-cysteine:1D-myo-inositol 2-amino-2-deoxy-alpha-D-glucopyranoside ligase [Luteococcus japonicus]|uniref:L-cysteine:1D-myo-inositol 2-amino-2-deoxy-alpha-D-glucopyranoside ligase n=1 Tax=Luteococcus japonicus TaxID=33984 RepID=A0A3N1ZZB3_9ACTN|nr:MULTISPECIES: cysteine--1-D-myo-inosityl 2-amino-2-deoxy-alpha-D-glucopyranoside ligase [Luteococcus]MDN5563109.1 cysteine--1-D-myo-inosityl 2-amino-2-deoxy-alpha-D-glucopyranoside ligase [Luteococcus sp.]ROR55827.1 L-cysteine:1D-myo-inositol 2-amino-2-deoxy-alpha-D-glucopyranoside ligase [Luteococcus japonicus]
MKAWSAPVVPSLTLPTPAAPARLSVHDTARQENVEAGPEQGTARLYVCGITPYDATHLGHANTYVTFDLLNRVWRDLGLQVRYAQNVTDVDDPLLERAAATGQDWTELAQDQTQLFRTDMEALRVLPPDAYVGAVESIPQVVALLESMKDSATLYQVDDPDYPDWYFRCEMAPGFGQVGNLDEQQMVTRFTEMGGDPQRPGKHHPLDCLVWRMERPGEPAWESSLGRGRPGWHIECTAIALDALGKHFDVQGGGSDLAFPHHEMCAAEGSVATGEPFAQVYLHSGMVALDGEKMSKSKGNLELVSRLRAQGHDPMAIRLALLGHHYRSNWEWTAEDLATAEQRLAIWREAVGLDAALDARPVIEQARTALRTDMDAPAALAAIDAWAQASLALDGDDHEAPGHIAAFADAVLGIAL